MSSSKGWAPQRSTDATRARGVGAGLPVVPRRRVARRLHTGGVRAQPRDPKALRAAGWATYGYSASHSRYFWGLRLRLLAYDH